ncbi:hypothetical protein CEXT_320711 [Caerostris extrusa]|uniref:Uncharacterized protein n=1 Tax=Caerostris extrusa TaxID=172846 RepID=A0AAV4V3N2_CAEEX|nr:hypothetical protein CEXT_320711 [Caerostris extrusa]
MREVVPSFTPASQWLKRLERQRYFPEKNICPCVKEEVFDLECCWKRKTHRGQKKVIKETKTDQGVGKEIKETKSVSRSRVHFSCPDQEKCDQGHEKRDQGHEKIEGNMREVPSFTAVSQWLKRLGAKDTSRKEDPSMCKGRSVWFEVVFA